MEQVVIKSDSLSRFERCIFLGCSLCSLVNRNGVNVRRMTYANNHISYSEMLTTGRQLQPLYTRMQIDSCLSLHQPAKGRFLRAELFA